MAIIYPQSQVLMIQPGVVASVAEARTEMWASSLFSCCEDMGTCCLGFWCPCCLACQVSSEHGEGLCLPLVDILSGMVPSVAMALRTSVRERYRIQGSICDDCCVVTFFSSCAFCQMSRELKKRRQRHLSLVTVTSNPPPYNQALMGHAHPQQFVAKLA
ncbi:hypothetical protein NHX12_013876 [Muraenolepis orangiensis]|uniref:Uncharacterized protein n=1 Tax=Muraenolepis orangiensis TaxID=630683 RepID=A0A9Q0DAC9_9TELE|nr:hypothetical protein NHX12_013876 [Muraenolepis orangiensis]